MGKELVVDELFKDVQVLLDALKIAKGIKKPLQFNVGDKVYCVDLEKCKSTTGKPEGKPQLEITVDEETIKALASGELEPIGAFMKGKVKIKGNMGPLMQLQGLQPKLEKLRTGNDASGRTGERTRERTSQLTSKLTGELSGELTDLLAGRKRGSQRSFASARTGTSTGKRRGRPTALASGHGLSRGAGQGPGAMKSVQTISGDLEKKLLSQDLAKEKDSDEDGGAKARVEFDSDFSLSEEEENAPEEADPFEGQENWSEVLTKVRKKNNTGAKGVKADYEEAKMIMRRRNETKRLQDAENFKREDNSDDSDDEEFLAMYRAQRVNQMTSLNELPKFGRVIPLDKFGFLDAVDEADPRTFVIVHIYEEYIVACQRMNKILEEVAMRHPYLKICKLVATEASQTLSHRALPAFIVYKGQELVNEAGVGVNENEFGTGHFTASEVEFFFASKYGIRLQGVDVSEQERNKGLSYGDSAGGDTSDKWQSSSGQSIGRVNLLQSRVSRMTVRDDDDDW
ncbi:Phosducin-like protein (PHLP) [Durusdinium trenchii]|uniref:Phosducin-like protein (PHLP) n=1 Tax=Durusdinium trenchii TaxID=1381693 RepID=A0ABP0KXY8_9DINO